MRELCNKGLITLISVRLALELNLGIVESVLWTTQMPWNQIFQALQGEIYLYQL